MLEDSLKMPLVEVALVFTGIFVLFSLIAYSSGRTELPQEESATTVCLCGSGSLNCIPQAHSDVA